MTSWKNYQSGVNPFISASRALEVTARAGLQQLEGEKGQQFWLHMTIPVIVMKAFSCEIMFKSLISYEGKEIEKKHYLDYLYNRLSEEHKKAVRESVVANMQKSIPSYNDKSFEQDLKQSAKLFEEWRYYFEESILKNKQTDETNTISAKLPFLDALFLQLEKIKNDLK